MRIHGLGESVVLVADIIMKFTRRGVPAAWAEGRLVKNVYITDWCWWNC